MMIGRRLNQMIHACVAISMAAYALAADQPGLLLIALAVLGLEFAFISRVGGRHLPRWAINIALGLATLVVLFELTRGGEGREFVSVIGRYLIWLQFIKLAEPKTARNLGQALALTAMLAVGAVLTNVALIVGLLLLVYIPLFLASVVVFQIYSGHVEAYGLPGELGGDQLRRGSSARARRAARRRRAAAAANATDKSQALDRIMHAGRSTPAGRRLAAGPGLGRSLVGTIAFSSVAIIAGSIALFVLIPRGIGESFLGGRLPTSAGGPQVTGFSTDLQLGGTGVISESTAIALYAQFSRSGIIIGSPERTWYLRGYVMDRYDPQRGRWIRSEATNLREHLHSESVWIQPDPAPRSSDLVQDITIRNNRSSLLFSVFRPVRVEGPGGQRFRHNIRPDGTIRLDSSADGVVSYTVRSREGLINPRPINNPPPLDDAAVDLEPDAIPDDEASDPDEATDRSPIQPPNEAVDIVRPVREDRGRFGENDPDGPRRGWQFQEGPIADLAATIAEQAGIALDPERQLTRDEIRTLALAIEGHLSIRCGYTLDQPPIRANEDPIEGFLFRFRRGHCEYFASASAALASAMRIPSRVVTGFHVSEWDPAARRYIVRESSAHAWAEVEIEPGVWIVIDPSAEDVRELNRPPTGLLAGLRRLVDQVEFLWVTRVVTFDSSSQQELALFDFTRIREWLERLNDRVSSTLQPNLREGSAQNDTPMIVRIAVNFLVIAGVLVGAVLAIAFVWRLAKRSGDRSRRAALAGIADPSMRRRLRFYQKMLDRLNKFGLTKPDWQPPARHAETIDTPAIRQIIERLTALYYTDRFGGTPLTEPQLAEAERLLATLDKHAAAANDRA